MKLKVDFVVPWVNNLDPSWIESFNKHSKKKISTSDVSDKRYRDWEIFKYWFRGVEKHAPWVNKVHLLTCGHTPGWLHTSHPKLNIVRHDEYIPKEYLPTFSSHPIELNMHRINDLSEHFVYFNDDFFIINKCSPSDFFTDGIPNDSAIFTAYDGLGISKIQLNSIAIINKHFQKKHVISKKPLSWLHPKYGTYLVRSLLLLPWRNFTGFYDHHLPNSFLKSTLNEIWIKEFESLDKASSNKFRNLNEDVSQYLFRFWQLASNNFHASSKHKLGDFCPVGLIPNDKVIKTLQRSKKPIIVINDHDPDDIDAVIMQLKQVFDQKFPTKSTFEL